MTYSERSTKLALDASVAVLALSNPEGTDIEFLSLKPKQMTHSDLAELAARWPGRNLRPIGVIGLVGAAPACAFNEPLEPEQVSALADAFLAYVHVLFCDSFADAEIQELYRLWSMEDPRD